jgi:hypothetical protein
MTVYLECTGTGIPRRILNSKFLRFVPIYSWRYILFVTDTSVFKKNTHISQGVSAGGRLRQDSVMSVGSEGGAAGTPPASPLPATPPQWRRRRMRTPPSQVPILTCTCEVILHGPVGPLEECRLDCWRGCLGSRIRAVQRCCPTVLRARRACLPSCKCPLELSWN